jgi:hypothetical protein
VSKCAVRHGVRVKAQLKSWLGVSIARCQSDSWESSNWIAACLRPDSAVQRVTTAVDERAVLAR